MVGTGVGARIGLQWNATPDISLGATYKSRTSMSKLGKYGDDLLAYSEGKVDIPAEYGIGVAWKATPSVTLAADFLEVQYSDVKVMQDPDGQKWKDQSILRLGASWEMNPTWTLRGGLSRGGCSLRLLRCCDPPRLCACCGCRCFRLEKRDAVLLGLGLCNNRALTGSPLALHSRCSFQGDRRCRRRRNSQLTRFTFFSLSGLSARSIALHLVCCLPANRCGPSLRVEATFLQRGSGYDRTGDPCTRRVGVGNGGVVRCCGILACLAPLRDAAQKDDEEQQQEEEGEATDSCSGYKSETRLAVAAKGARRPSDRRAVCSRVAS
jgi:hypothetical protein